MGVDSSVGTDTDSGVLSSFPGDIGDGGVLSGAPSGVASGVLSGVEHRCGSVSGGFCNRGDASGTAAAAFWGVFASGAMLSA